MGPEIDDQVPGVSLFERGRAGRMVKILVTGSTVSTYAEFSPDGLHVAWGNPDGTVSLCDLPEIQRRLAEVRMGW